jgi:hypothetical protein
MADTCKGLDSSAQQDVLEALRAHIKANRGRYQGRPGGLTHHDAHGACLIWDLYRDADLPSCQGDECHLAQPDGAGKRKKKRNHQPQRKID